MDILKTLQKASGNDLSSVVKDGTISDVKNFIDSGCYLFNAQLSGSIYKGIPENKIVGLAGQSTVGKTFLTLGIVKNFLDENKDGLVVWADSETAVEKKMFEDRDIDSKRILYLPVDTIENYKRVRSF